MKKLRLPLLLLLFSLVAFGCSFKAPDTSGMNNVDFAKTVFSGLVNGDQSVQSLIDWEVFRAGPSNVATSYNAQTSDSGKATFRTSFIFSFGQGFRATGSTAAGMSNWGQTSEDANWAVVQATNPGRGNLIMTISKRGGVRRLAAIDLPPPPVPAAPSWQAAPTYQPNQ